MPPTCTKSRVNREKGQKKQKVESPSSIIHNLILVKPVTEKHTVTTPQGLFVRYVFECESICAT